MDSTARGHAEQVHPELSGDRVVRLQSVIAALMGTLTPEEGADTVLLQAIEALRAHAGSVVLVTEDEWSRLNAAERIARAEAEAGRARWYNLFMRAPARIALSRGPEHVYTFANERYVAELDHPDIIGRSARDVFPGAHDQGIIAVADRVFATGEPFIARETLFRVDRDGTEEDRYFDVVLQPTYESDGTIEGVMLFSMDVTEAVRSRQRVEELLAQRNAILGQMADWLGHRGCHGTHRIRQ